MSTRPRRDQIATALVGIMSRNSEPVWDQGILWAVRPWEDVAAEAEAELGLSAAATESHITALDPEGRRVGFELFPGTKRWRTYLPAEQAALAVLLTATKTP